MGEMKPFGRTLPRKDLCSLDACTRCGECLKVCPVQEVARRREISPPEKIKRYREFIRNTEGLKAWVLGAHALDREALEDFVRAIFECTTCGACGQTCTVGIDTQRLWPGLRKEMVERGLGPIGALAGMPEIVARTGNPYDLPAGVRFTPWFPSHVAVAERAEVAYYAGCTGCYEAQPMVRGDVKVLSAIGEPFTMLPAGQEVCCGFPLFITGQHGMLKDLVRTLVDGYAAKGVHTLVCSCPCCVNMMGKDWPLYYGKVLPFRIRHITQYVADALRSGKLSIRKSLKERIIYHDPCYLSRGVGVIREPREVLRAIPGVTILEFDRNRENSRCCGAGGAARKVFHENAVAMGRLTINEALTKGADRLILSCPACHSKVHEAMAEYDRKIRITDIMELIGSLIEEP